MTQVREEWSPAEIEILLDCVQLGNTPGEIQSKLAIAGYARSIPAIEHQRKRQRGCKQAPASNRIADSPYPVFSNPLILEGDALTLFDLHVPYHDAVWLNRVIRLAKKWGITRCGIGGDLVDLAAFSLFGHGADALPKTEVLATEQLLHVLVDNFEVVYYCTGNHENRLARQLDFMFDLVDITKLWVHEGRIVVSDYQYFIVKSGDQSFYCGHPASISVHATVVPKALAVKLQSNTICGHGHLWGMARDPSNTFWAIDAGMCGDPSRLAYAAKKHNTRPQMQRGAVVIRNGTPILLGPENITLYETCSFRK